MSCGVGHRRGLDLTLLWLWHSLAATTLIGPLAWEPPYAWGWGMALKAKKKNHFANPILPVIPHLSPPQHILRQI